MPLSLPDHKGKTLRVHMMAEAKVSMPTTYSLGASGELDARGVTANRLICNR